MMRSERSFPLKIDDNLWICAGGEDAPRVVHHEAALVFMSRGARNRTQFAIGRAVRRATVTGGGIACVTADRGTQRHTAAPATLERRETLFTSVGCLGMEIYRR